MANDEPGTTRTVSTRRDFLRNSAVAGGVAWAAPTVLSLGPNAFATNGGSERCYRFRYEVSNTGNADPDDDKGAFFECEPGNDPNWAGCDPIEGYGNYACVDFTNYPDDPDLAPEASIPDGDITVDENADGSVTFTLPAGCVFQIVEAKAGGGGQGQGGGNSTLDCSEDVTFDEAAPNIFTVSMGGDLDGDGTSEGPVRAVSHVDVVFCCS